MILAYYGRWVPLEELRVRCGVSRDGSRADNILKAARQYGLEAQGFRSEIRGIFELSFPMIVFWEFNHFVVVEGIRDNTVYVNDPAEGPCKMTMQEFDKGFTGVCLTFKPGPQFRREGSMPSLTRGLLSRFRKAYSPMTFVILGTLVKVIPGLAIATFSKVFVDDVLIPRSSSMVVPLLIGLGLAAVLQAAITWMQQICLGRMEVKLSMVTSMHFFWHVATLPMTFFGQRFAGDIADRVQSNDKVVKMMTDELATNLAGMLTMVVYGAVMILYDAVLTLVALLMVALNLLALWLVSRRREHASRRTLRERGKIVGTSVNGVHMIETLKASGLENDFFERWSGMHANALSSQQELGILTNLLNVVPPLLSSLTTVAVLAVGGLRIVEGAITIGGLVAFQALAQRFASPVEGLIKFGADLQTIKADIARLDDVLNYAPGRHGVENLTRAVPEAIEPARGVVSLENVTFGHNEKEPPLIENFSLTIQPGQRVALVGSSGSGKSTLGLLICGLLKPWSGTVRIDDRVVTDIPASELAESLSYVDQEIMLFEATVRENVTLWNSSRSERDIIRALRDAVIHNEITHRPGKYEAPVAENGRNFSGGQRQRLEIARALVSNPAVLVLDEATAALDPLTELEIDSNLRRRGCTCVIVAHRLSTIRDADEIILLEGGRIVQRGHHDRLVQEDGPYRMLISAS